MRRFTLSLCAGIVLTGAAAAQPLPTLETNQAYVESVTAKTSLAVDDPMAVFAYVLDSLPARVKVYPTENHYYFSFLLDGIRYAGNIKLDAQLRSEGKVLFSLYEDRPVWLSDKQGSIRVLGAEQGVTVKKLDALTYQLGYKGKSVVFALNDLSKVKPPAAALAPGEQFIGPVFDDSAVRFFLVFDPKLKLFHYILDETIKPADVLVPAPVGGGRILIGKRTGFAFYRDKLHDRKLMIGAYEGNIIANNYLDGPFDQMPDNFMKDDTFRQAILAVVPNLKGHINRYGSLDDGARIAINNYMEYRDPKDLEIFDRCATDPRTPPDLYEACFALPLEAEHGPQAKPIAMLRDTP
jgi:hypothetical protein